MRSNKKILTFLNINWKKNPSFFCKIKNKQGGFFKMNRFKINNIKKINRFNKIEISALIGLLSAILVCFFNCFSNCDRISKNVIRLHILANSNSKQDQNLKIKLRDEILKNFNFDNLSNDKEKAKIQINEKIPEIEKLAKKTIEDEGFCYDVKAKLEKTYFSTREYDSFSMPAGFYDALRVEIGQAKGKNWWCVMVPSMCILAANKKEKIFDSFSESEKDLLKKGKKTEFRFATLLSF